MEDGLEETAAQMNVMNAPRSNWECIMIPLR